MRILKKPLLSRSLQFENEKIPPADPNPVQVETVAEVTILSEGSFSVEDGKFIADFIVIAHDQPTLRITDNEHNYCSFNSKPSAPVVTTDIGVLVNTLTSIVAAQKFLDFLTTDEHMKAYTNFMLDQFEKLSSLLESTLLKINYNVCFKLDMREMLFLCLVKLKLNITFRCLAVMLEISYTTATSYFNFMIDLLQQSLPVPWPPQEVIRKSVPYCFKKYKNTLVVLDCSETRVESPSCAVCRIKIYSHYKSGYTIKYLIGISPSGLIILISVVYGGRASDSFIVQNSAVLNKLEYSDAVMTDKGFKIEEDCEALLGVELICPPFLRKKAALEKSEALENESIASARVHVERVIQRMKTYSILKHTIPWELVNRADKIVHVICELVNLQRPIIEAERGQSKKSLIQHTLTSTDEVQKRL